MIIDFIKSIVRIIIDPWSQMFLCLKYQEKKLGYDRIEKVFDSLNIDLSDQYSYSNGLSEYTKKKIQLEHSFQVSFTAKLIKQLIKCDKIPNYKGKVNVVDIGDSAGTHIRKLRAALERDNIAIDGVSVNLDPIAIEKIRSNGGKAVLCRAEDYKADERVDIYMSFEMVEHLHNPAIFFHNIAKADNAAHTIAAG